MTLFVVLALLLPWSVWRQRHAHEISKLPVIFAATGLSGLQRGDIPSSAAAAVAMSVSLALSVGLGVVRGAVGPIWRDARGSWLSHGDRLTIARRLARA
jgi:hypothetical protein